MNSGASCIHHYYVDEAGDLTFFDKKGKLIVGQNGVSKVFLVGVVRLLKPKLAHEYLEGLRKSLLADPYFKGVPSMQPDAGKTALCFHACKDTAEVRYEVFKLLPRIKAKVLVAIRRKVDIAHQAKKYWRTTGRKLSLNDIYDDLVKRMFKNLLHKAKENRIVFARRGKADRYEALHRAIARAKENFKQDHQKPSDRPTMICSASPHEFVGLQVADYYLWALQRLYERQEDRYFNLLATDYRLIMDLDDQTNNAYGEWYSDDNPLSLKKIKPVAG